MTIHRPRGRKVAAMAPALIIDRVRNDYKEVSFRCLFVTTAVFLAKKERMSRVDRLELWK